MRRGEKLTDLERCRAIGARSGRRCPFRKTQGELCDKHVVAGAIVPDDWTQPDNLPVFYVRKENP